jgi:palmitoyltransferase
MSSKSTPSETQGSSPSGQTPGSTSSNDKGVSTPPNADVELKTMGPSAPKRSIPLGEDIMQLARIGEIGAMQNLFATKKLTANHRDDEGITPLHVGLPPSIAVGFSGMGDAMGTPD